VTNIRKVWMDMDMNIILEELSLAQIWFNWRAK